MKQTTLLILLSGALLTTGCKTHKTVQEQLPIVPIETNTDTKIVHIETIDTVFIEIPAQSAERTTPGKESHLETDYAESDARINEDGTLTHTLHNKPTKQPVGQEFDRHGVRRQIHREASPGGSPERSRARTDLMAEDTPRYMGLARNRPCPLHRPGLQEATDNPRPAITDQDHISRQRVNFMFSRAACPRG